ncbi:hypothetical protein [Rappaport israeli]|uniref:hypothetical protein n=1 Tax=Rappaport israeli TaxID=1839807 RepID=UPI001E3C704B|nr:hypothetical protein [Rappaport israeli]
MLGVVAASFIGDANEGFSVDDGFKMIGGGGLGEGGGVLCLGGLSLGGLELDDLAGGGI